MENPEETREAQQNEILTQYREAAEEARREADIAHMEARRAQAKAEQAQSRADDSVAHYHARKIGGLLGQTTSQDSFADFPYGASRYPSGYSGDLTPDKIGIDRGDRWTEHRLERDKLDGEVEYLTVYSDTGFCDIICQFLREAEQAARAAREAQCLTDPTECPDEPEPDEPEPYVNFGWWIKRPSGIYDAGHKFATFVDGSHKYSIASLGNFSSGSACYEGPAAGVFVKRERTTLNTYWSPFTAVARLTASFNSSDRGVSIGGSITDFVDSGSDTELDGWSLTLEDIWGSDFSDLEREHHFPSPLDSDDPSIGVQGAAAGYSLTGTWQGSFYEGTENSTGYPETVAGQFRAFSHTVGTSEEPDVTMITPTHFNDEGFLGLAGAFGAHKQPSPALIVID